MVRLSAVEADSRPDGVPTERADAARNRRAILEAAAMIFTREGTLSVDAVAAAASVGKGTLYRRFGDRAGLAEALLAPAASELRTAVRSGPPPLGPGRDPADRLAAFLAAYHDLVERNRPLAALAEESAPGDGSIRAFARAHVETLLVEGRPDLDAIALAGMLLAPLAAAALSGERGRSISPVRTDIALGILVRQVFATPRVLLR